MRIADQFFLRISSIFAKIVLDWIFLINFFFKNLTVQIFFSTKFFPIEFFSLIFFDHIIFWKTFLSKLVLVENGPWTWISLDPTFFGNFFLTKVAKFSPSPSPSLALLFGFIFSWFNHPHPKPPKTIFFSRCSYSNKLIKQQQHTLASY